MPASGRAHLRNAIPPAVRARRRDAVADVGKRDIGAVPRLGKSERTKPDVCCNGRTPSAAPSTPGPAMEDLARHFVFALVDDFTHIAFSCAIEPLRLANLVSGRTLYRWSFASADGRPVKSSNGIVTHVDHSFDKMPPCDQLFVLSGIDMQHKETALLAAALRRARAGGTPIGALCSGAYILAKAGFLKGMKAAIHWEYHDSFEEEFPEVELVRSVFVADEKCITASGGTAAADLMLHLIDRDHGYEVSVAVADQMVYNAVRTPAASQRISLQARSGTRNRHLVRAIEIMRKRIEHPVSAAEIADEIGVSTRQIQRIFIRHMHMSPKRYFQNMRLERARHLILQTESSITEIAFACGFGNLGYFSRLYKSVYGKSPSLQRGR